ncbi:FecR domain-containing protein [Luteimonas sp. Y-2-2-4F]|nr:FecR domain-containing protein [Luteimonas sp. Y-2-2-4F]MCD9032117.1 FecR domain-containing protein [Luteimonas sp. Y-2-2-4F]
MSDVLKLRTLAEIEEEAAAWVWRLDGDAVPAADRAGFERWLQRDPRHRRAFEELGGVWRSLDELAEAKREEKVATFVAEERRLSAARGPARPRRHARIAGWAAAATLVLVLGVFSWSRQGTEAQTLATAVGQQRRAALADGSSVRLNTNTIVETRFTRGERTVRVVKGEALFEVARNPARPFVVVAGDTRVRALGTAFNVRVHERGAVEVIVTEGRVEVARIAAADAEVRPQAGTDAALAIGELRAGQRFRPDASSPVATLSRAALGNSLAWREGAIVFDGEPLGRAIDELNRYADTRLVIADEAIRDLRIGGRFRTGDVEGFVEALTRAFPVDARRAADDLVYLERRPPASPTPVH